MFSSILIIGSKNEVVEVTSKSETNYSKSRVKVSPYRRSTRISEQFSTIANYSGKTKISKSTLFFMYLM